MPCSLRRAGCRELRNEVELSASNGCGRTAQLLFSRSHLFHLFYKLSNISINADFINPRFIVSKLKLIPWTLDKLNPFLCYKSISYKSFVIGLTVKIGRHYFSDPMPDYNTNLLFYSKIINQHCVFRQVIFFQNKRHYSLFFLSLFSISWFTLSP